MKIRNFKEDLDNSNKPKLRKSWENIFKLKFGEDCQIEWKDDVELQKGLGTDITIKTKQGRRYSVELKTRNNNCLNKDWIMEIISHVYDKEEKPRTHLNSKEGWIYTTTAEYIFHGTLNENGTDLVEVIFYSLIPFKTEKWKSEFDKYEILWLSTLYSNGNFQLTINKLIPKEVIKEDTLEFWEWTK
ncbi:hypothetical protein LCGC14_2031980 [marine sediment metagenome]|uniref:Uncharacterized protein n=1 Tax=marine sediment metagenome TaxID=412755 RepID=A0A0F9EUC7_9ZZZZ